MKIPIEIRKQLEALADWDDWTAKQNTLFGLSDWEEISVAQLERELSRDEILVDGTKWEPFSYPYKIPSDLIDLYEEAQRFVFCRFDSEGHKENQENPHRFGKKCNECKLWTRTADVEECPFCGRRLLPTPLNDD